MQNDVSISKITSRALDKLDEFSYNVKFAKQQKDNKRIQIGNYLNGQIPYAGAQTAAGRLDNN